MLILSSDLNRTEIAAIICRTFSISELTENTAFTVRMVHFLNSLCRKIRNRGIEPVLLRSARHRFPIDRIYNRPDTSVLTE